MKHSKKKLDIQTETLRNLTNQELRQIAGALSFVTCPTLTCLHLGTTPRPE